MKVRILVLLMLSWNLVFGQIQFEIDASDVVELGSSSFYAGAEVDTGYLFAGYYTYNALDYQRVLLLMNREGGIIDTALFLNANNSSNYYSNIYETPNSYVMIGQKRIENDTNFYFWKGEYSKSLELLSEDYYPLPFCNKETHIHYTWDGVSDTILYTSALRNPPKLGMVIPETGEVYAKDVGYASISRIIRRANKPGYLASGYSFYLMDEQFNIESTLHFLPLMKSWQLGLETAYVSDTSFFFSTLYNAATTSGNSTIYTTPGNPHHAGVMIGVMSEDLEVMAWDTIQIYPISTTWTLAAQLEHYLIRSSDSTFIVAGETFPYDSNNRGLFCAKYSITGERLFSNTYYMDANRKYKVSPLATSDGGCLLYGLRRRLSGSNYDFYVLKLGPDGLVTSETSVPIPSISAIKSYPNPTSDIISFDLQDIDQELNLELLNLQGQIVLRQKVTGREEISTNHLPKGVYAYRLLNKAGKVLYAGKMIKE